MTTQLPNYQEHTLAAGNGTRKQIYVWRWAASQSDGLQLSRWFINHKWILRRPVCDIEVTLAMCKYIVDHHLHHTMVTMLMYVGLT